MISLNNIIILNRGDTLEFTLDIKSNYPELYPLMGNDTIYFGVMDPGQPFETALIRKSYTSKQLSPEGVLTVELTPEDTLDLIPAKYYYAIKMHVCHSDYANKGQPVDKVYTLINKTKFILCD